MDSDAQKIRICFESLEEGDKATLREYFRRNAIFFRVELQDRRINSLIYPLSRS